MKTFILIMFCLLIGFLAGKSKSAVDYHQGVSDGIDNAIVRLDAPTNRLKNAYVRSIKKVDSLIADYEAFQVESFANHSEIK